jgi:hypothetical protein
MASSERKAYVRFKDARLATDEPFHAFTREMVGNINHLADQFAQRRCAWVAIDSSQYFDPEVGAGSISADTYYRCWQSVPFDLHVRENGESYALRLRIRGARSGGSGTVSFRVAIAAESHARAYYTTLANGNVGAAATSSATHAWLEMGPALARLSTQHVSQATRVLTNAIDEIDGDAVRATWLRCTAEIWATTTSTASVPRFSGLQIDEYYDGP